MANIHSLIKFNMARKLSPNTVNKFKKNKTIKWNKPNNLDPKNFEKKKFVKNFNSSSGTHEVNSLRFLK